MADQNIQRKRSLAVGENDSNILEADSSKRLALDTEDQPSISPSIAPVAPLTIDEDFLEKYQKEAIWREMNIYKGRLLRAEQKSDRLETAEVVLEEHRCLLERWWKQVSVVFCVLLPLLKTDDEETNTPEISEMITMSPFNSEEEKELLSRLNTVADLVRIVFEKISSVRHRQQAILEEINALMMTENRTESENKLINLIKDSESNRSKLEKNYFELVSKVQVLTDRLASSEQLSIISREKLTKMEKAMNETQQILVHTERSLARERSKYGKIVDMPSTVASENPEQQSVTNSEAQPSGSDDFLKATLQEIEELREKYDLASSLADTRLYEMERLRDDCARLRYNLDQAQIDLQALPDNRVAETGLYRQIKRQLDFYKADSELLRAKIETLNKEIEELKSLRRESIAKITKEESEKRSILEAEMKKLSADLNRIRAARDQLQQQLEIERTRQKKHDDANTDLRLNANANKERIRCLLEEIKRMKARMAAVSGDEKLYENVLIACELGQSQGETDAEQSPAILQHKSLIQSLQERLEISEKREKSLKDQLDAIDLSKEQQMAADAINREKTLKRSLESIQKKIERYETLFGSLDSIAASDAPLDSNQLREQLKRKQFETDALSLRIKSFQQAEESTVNEIEMISKSFTKLESRQTQQMNLLTEKEEQIAKLLAERIKNDQKLSAMQKEKDSHSNKAIALSKQSQKQLELIRKAEEDLAAKESTLIAIERELAVAKSLISVHERKAQEALELAEELTAKIEKSGAKYSEVSNIMRERDQEVNACQAKIQGLDEENRKLQNKVKHLNKKLHSAAQSGSAEELNSTELETLRDWKKIAQCSVCEFRIKNHVLLKCMHVFCKECIDARIETRQRKCPQCGIMFGPGDVKQIFI